MVILAVSSSFFSAIPTQFSLLLVTRDVKKPDFHFSLTCIIMLLLLTSFSTSIPDVPLATPEGSLPVDSSPRKSQRSYLPIPEDLEDVDVTSVDSYTMAMEGEGR